MRFKVHILTKSHKFSFTRIIDVTNIYYIFVIQSFNKFIYYYYYYLQFNNHI